MYTPGQFFGCLQMPNMLISSKPANIAEHLKLLFLFPVGAKFPSSSDPICE